MEIVTTSSKGQLVIPESVRKRYKIKKGTRFILLEQRDRIVLEREDKFNRFMKERKEEKGWVTLAEESLKEVWDNEKDEKVWKKYL